MTKPFDKEVFLAGALTGAPASHKPGQRYSGNHPQPPGPR